MHKPFLWFRALAVAAVFLSPRLVEAGPSIPSPSFVRAWGTTGSGAGQFRAIDGIAADAAGALYVCDVLNTRIQKFDTAGTFVQQWGSFGADPGEFISAPDVAVDPSGSIFVLDQTGHRVEKFSPSGAFVLQWGGTPGVSFAMPRAIAADATGRIYVGDGLSRVAVFDGAGGFIRQWGSSGPGAGQFQVISSIATGPDGTVYVLDSSLERVQAFTPEGTFITQWGSPGSGEGQFSGPQGIAVDGQGVVFVVDTDNDRVQLFTSQGMFLTQWGQSGTAPGQLSSPQDITIVGQSYYVTDLFSRVQQFSYLPVPAQGTSWGKIKARYRT